MGRMHAAAAALALAAAAASGCGKGEPKEAPARGDEGVLPAPPTRPAKEQEVAPVPHAFQGPVTVDALRRAKDGVQPHQDWSAAWAHLMATVGEPARTEGDRMTWGVMQGGQCHLLQVRRDPSGERVDMVSYGAFDEGTEEWGRCGGGPEGAAPDEGAESP